MAVITAHVAVITAQVAVTATHVAVTAAHVTVTTAHVAVIIIILVVCGRVHLQQGVNTADAQPRNQLAGRQALKLGTQVQNRSQITEAGVVRRRHHRVRFEGGLGGGAGGGGEAAAVLIDDLLVQVAIVVNRVDPIVAQLGAIGDAAVITAAASNDRDGRGR